MFRAAALCLVVLSIPSLAAGDGSASSSASNEHWAFQPLRVNDAKRGIDAFIEEALVAHGLSAAPRASRVTQARRLWLDMLGLPPSPSRLREFLGDDSEHAWAKLVDEVVVSPRHGERWAQHWLDVVRYADTHGFEVNTPRENAWPYRDYVIHALNSDTPYDQFVLEQIAGDAIGASEATGFLVAAAALLPGQIGKDAESMRLARQDELDEIISGTAATLLGLTLGCARCHDHKFDPISVRDYYRFQAFFAGVVYGDIPVERIDREEPEARAAKLRNEIAKLESRLADVELHAFEGRTLLIDEEDPDRVSVLKKKNGPGANPAGTARGYRDDVGTATRVSNISRGRYTWWNNSPGEDVLTFEPGESGRFRLWVSWGAHGSGVHTRDARYVLDADGDLGSRDDQRELARVDQYYPAGVTAGTTEKKPLWSGLLDVGVVELEKGSKIVLRCGETGTGITADVIVLQEELRQDGVSKKSAALPRLREPVDPLRNVERFESVRARFVRFTTLATDNDNHREPCIDELEVFTTGRAPRNVALASAGGVPSSSGNYSDIGRHQLKHINDGAYGNERSWISNEVGGGWVQIELADEHEIDRIEWGRDRNGKFRDRLAIRYRIDVSLDGEAWTRVAGHDDRILFGSPHDRGRWLLRYQPDAAGADLEAVVAEIDRLRTEESEAQSKLVVFGGKSKTPDATFVLRRGDPEQRGEEVDAAIPTLFGAIEELAALADQDRRLALGRWIASAANPLTARVIVNRVWLQHFGRGLVATPSDFGENGGRPSHPELLDWLASELVRSGWSLRHVHRLILLSEAYRRSSHGGDRERQVDRDNRLLWRFAPRRLEAEAIRDSLLAASGELQLGMGGKGFDFFRSRGGLNGFPPVTDFGPEALRRMVYSHKVRMEPVPVFGAFDCPDAGQPTPLRSRSTTAIQALNLFNSEFVTQRAQMLARRVESEEPSNISRQVSRAFEIVFGREPGETERVACEKVVGEHGVATLARVLFNSNEFLFLP